MSLSGKKLDWARIPGPVRACCAALWEAGHAAYPVGGCVRDLLLDRAPGDWDAATSALPWEVQALFPRTVPTGLRHGTVTVLLDGMPIEVTTFRGESGYSDGRHPDRVIFGVGLEADLARRDFTVNALALGPEGGVIDRFGGLSDLDGRRVRCVGDPDRRFREDALRMLRGTYAAPGPPPEIQTGSGEHHERKRNRGNPPPLSPRQDQHHPCAGLLRQRKEGDRLSV